MAEVKYRKTELRSKNQNPNRPRRKLGRTRVVVNKQPIDLSKLVARRKLVVRR
jgi:hypothetical protein